MEVQVAEGSGFCFGVKRAVTMAKTAAGAGRIYSLGPLIHNPREIARLSVVLFYKLLCGGRESFF